jgi:putative transposase
VQSASTDYVSRLEEIGARSSMSASGNPYDTATAESFFRTLKREMVSSQMTHSVSFALAT